MIEEKYVLESLEEIVGKEHLITPLCSATGNRRRSSGNGSACQPGRVSAFPL